MTEQQREAHRQQLQALALRLRGEVAGLRDSAMRRTDGEASGILSNTPHHLADLGSDTFEQEVAVGLLNNEQHILDAITGAFDRLEAGTYGRCEQCGKNIPEERLKAVPYADCCVACQEKRDRSEHGGYG